jgi:FMN phosphatase YigB (HAD superfamily)
MKIFWNFVLVVLGMAIADQLHQGDTPDAIIIGAAAAFMLWSIWADEQ